MTSSPPPPPASSQPPEPPGAYIADPAGHERSTNQWSGCLIGCLIALGICSLLCAGVGVYVFSNFKGWATQLGRQVIESTIEEAELPEEEKAAIMQEVDRIAGAYEEGEITTEQLGQIMQDLAESKVWGMIVVQAIKVKYLEPSGLSDEEKEQGRQTISRVLRGAIEERISDRELETLSEHFLVESEEGPEGTQTLKESLTDEELRALLAAARELADRKEIPEEDFEFRFSEKIREIVDEALQSPR